MRGLLACLTGSARTPTVGILLLAAASTSAVDAAVANSGGGALLRRADANVDDDSTTVDWSALALQFQKCVTLQPHPDTPPSDQEQGITVTVEEQQQQQAAELPPQRFAMFQLCETTNETQQEGTCVCSPPTGDGTTTVIQDKKVPDQPGTYLMDLNDYLELTTGHLVQIQDERCSHAMSKDPENNELYDECQKIINMEANGYLDATMFLGCQMFWDDVDTGPLYAGPICTEDGHKIKIGVSTDKDCRVVDTTKEVEEYLVSDGYMMKLSYYTLRQAYDRSSCISCRSKEDELQVLFPDDDDMVIQLAHGDLSFCQELIEGSIQCDSSQEEAQTGHALVCELVHFAEMKADLPPP